MMFSTAGPRRLVTKALSPCNQTMAGLLMRQQTRCLAFQKSFVRKRKCFPLSYFFFAYWPTLNRCWLFVNYTQCGIDWSLNAFSENQHLIFVIIIFHLVALRHSAKQRLDPL